MKNKIILAASIILVSSTISLFGIDSLVVQENTLGICTMDGVFEDGQTGYTGEGYINVDNGLNIGMSWSINASSAGSYDLQWRYALGGSDITSRDAALYINNILVDSVIFPHLESLWNVWENTAALSVELKEGVNNIRLASITPKGLGNIDYFVVFGSGFTMSECLPTYTVSIESNNPNYGGVYYSPIQQYYDVGTEVTVVANPNNDGYFFHSWSGEESSVMDTFKFNIKENTNLTALFYPNGTEMIEGATGYATIQHDNGTPYLLTGGSLGKTVEPQTLQELKTYLNSTDTLVINISKHFVGTGEISIQSNKSIIGVTDSAHIEGIMMAVNNCRNVVFKDMVFSKVIQMDEMEINGSKNILIDHCEFFTDRLHDKDYYDGLLDIKNASNWITVSYTNFHDHAKCILISSGDDSFQDSVQRITFHHNFFHDDGSRLPSIRFGKCHIFSNYYLNNGGAIHTRVGACVKVEHNYFKNVSGAIGQSQAFLDMEPNTNIFVSSSYSTDIPPCKLDVPYQYESLIDSASTLPELIPPKMLVWKPGESSSLPQTSILNQVDGVKCFPNPGQDQINLSFSLLKSGTVAVDIYNLYGNQLKNYTSNQMYTEGQNVIPLNISDLETGVYIVQLMIGNNKYQKILLKE